MTTTEAPGTPLPAETVPEVEHGIAETSDVLDALTAMAVAYKKAKEDDIVNWKDLLNKETRDLIPAVKNAIQDANLIPAELTNLSGEEAAELYQKLTVVFMAVTDAFFTKAILRG